MDEIDNTLREVENFEAQLDSPFADPTQQFAPPPQFDFTFTTPQKQQYTPPPPSVQRPVQTPVPPKQQIAPPPPPPVPATPAVPAVSATPAVPVAPVPVVRNDGIKYCKFCGHMIHAEAALCPHCGRQVEYIEGAMPVFAPPPQVGAVGNVINANAAGNGVYSEPAGVRKDKWVAVVLCLFLGLVGAHRFYEGKIGTGILYLCTFWTGWTLIAAFVDLIIILQKPNPYYVEKRGVL